MRQARSNLPVEGARLWADVMALAEITDPAKPYTRRSFSPLFLQGRDWLRRRFEEAGLAVRLDPGGNLIGRLPGADPSAGTIMIGSHSDTVPSGGRFDGIAGVATALEIVRSLRDAGRTTRHSIEVVDFLAEEPSEYGLSCVGSRAMTGLLSPATHDYRNPAGERLGDAVERVGGDLQALDEGRREDVAAFFELHIEQGIVLEKNGIDLGIVSAIAGIARVGIRFEGRADHAGTTPMDLRHDAGLAAALTVAAVNELATARARSGRGHFVATVGVLELTPNASNVVPGSARLVIDIRAEDHSLTQDFLASLDERTAALAAASKVLRQDWSVLSNTAPVACDPELGNLLREAAEELGFSTISMASGAGHDAAFMAHIAPSAMVFVPCRDGRSHTPEEWTDADAIAAGAAAIYQAVLRFDAAKY